MQLWKFLAAMLLGTVVARSANAQLPSLAALELNQHHQQQPDTATQEEAEEFPLVMVPGCKVSQGPDSYELPTGRQLGLPDASKQVQMTAAIPRLHDCSYHFVVAAFLRCCLVS